MSWAFIHTMRSNPWQNYVQVCALLLRVFDPADHAAVQVLQSTRALLVQNYSQIPQLSIGGKYDLNQPVSVRIPVKCC